MSTATKNAVIFDLDDTLCESTPGYKIALEEVFKVINSDINNIMTSDKSVTMDKVKEYYKLSRAEINRELAGTATCHNRVLYFQRFVEKLCGSVDSDLILKLYNTYWDNFIKNIELGKNVLLTLKKLKELGIKTAIISDLTANIQLRKISKLGISPYIDALVTSEEAGREKPNPIMFLLALKKLNVQASETLMVGDSLPRDIEGGNSMGLETALLVNKYSQNPTITEDYKKPTHTIKDIEEILKII